MSSLDDLYYVTLEDDRLSVRRESDGSVVTTQATAIGFRLLVALSHNLFLVKVSNNVSVYSFDCLNHQSLCHLYDAVIPHVDKYSLALAGNILVTCSETVYDRVLFTSYHVSPTPPHSPSIARVVKIGEIVESNRWNFLFCTKISETEFFTSSFGVIGGANRLYTISPQTPLVSLETKVIDPVEAAKMINLRDPARLLPVHDPLSLNSCRYYWDSKLLLATFIDGRLDVYSVHSTGDRITAVLMKSKDLGYVVTLGTISGTILKCNITVEARALNIDLSTMVVTELVDKSIPEIIFRSQPTRQQMVDRYLPLFVGTTTSGQMCKDLALLSIHYL